MLIRIIKCCCLSAESLTPQTARNSRTDNWSADQMHGEAEQMNPGEGRRVHGCQWVTGFLLRCTTLRCCSHECTTWALAVFIFVLDFVPRSSDVRYLTHTHLSPMIYEGLWLTDETA